MIRAAVVAALFFAAAPARAERGHVRRTLAGVAGSIELERGGALGDAAILGGDLRLALSPRDDVDLGASASLLVARDVTFRGAVIDGLPGELHANLYAPSLALDARWVLGVDYSRVFARTRPVVGLSTGLLVEILTDQVHLSESASELARPDTAITLAPFAALSLGVEHRLSGRITLGLLGTARAGSGLRQLAVHLELSWITF